MPSRFKEALGFVKIMRSETPYHTKHEDDFDATYVDESSALKIKTLLESMESPLSDHVTMLNRYSGFYHNLYAAFTFLYEIDAVLDQIEYEGISLANAEALIDSCALLQVVSSSAIIDIDDRFSFANKYSLARDIYVMAKNM